MAHRSRRISPSEDFGTSGDVGMVLAPEVAEAIGAVDGLEQQLAERTADLKRLKAEYDNYRKRVGRERQAVRELAIVDLLRGLLPVLDDIDRARAHGEVHGGFKAVVESLETVLVKFGLESFGTVGEIFDPTLHEAFIHLYSDEVDQPTCVVVLRPGYRVGERIVRPARVSVAEPTAPFGDQYEFDY
jgi:molecular chaperone GrpE